jgi:BlaI family transcriptional regulator, penicillinase repressor
MRLTDAEWILMNALWKSHPATARQIADALPGEVAWAYTTIKTMLDRLVEKGVLAEAKKGPTSVYSPVIARHTAQASALKALVNHAFDGAFGPLVHFLIEDKKLSSRDRKTLMEALRKDGKE